jgi:CelD/BcsL family acetyltransferase involved in cellulose biosynthesis
MQIGSIIPSADASPLEALLPRVNWDAIGGSGLTPMQHFTWNEACFATMYRDSPAALLTTEGGIAPFVRKGVIPTLYLAGAVELGEPSEALYADAAAAERLVDAILAQQLPVNLGQPPAGTPFSDAFISRAGAAGLLVTRPTEGSPYIELDDSWKDALKRFSSRRRSDFRRMRRRAEEEGRVAFEFHQPAPHEASALLDQAIAVEARSWKSRTRTAIADNKVQMDFFRRYARLASAEGMFRVAFMKIGSVTAAAQICAEYDGGFWLFKIGYDERFARCSPGQLLMLESIESAARRGLKRYEFLGKAADWTTFWTSTERPRIRLKYYPRNTVGAAAMVRDAAVVVGKRVRRLFADRKDGLPQHGHG